MSRTSSTKAAAGTPGGRRNRTVKVALVLYGGVSLAIYENGVTRAFYDLVMRRGIFRPLLDLLDSDAEIDVIAGTSAGGINGLILAAALESGQDFADSAALWRRLGDFGSLLRQVNDKGASRSLLDGDGYYQRQLIEGFKTFCEPRPGARPYPGEIDLFITGTELVGTVTTFQDDRGNELADKTHRALFHLKHRPGRRWLGLTPDSPGAGGPRKEAETVHRQAHIFAALSRITSCFPAAFPPFTAGEMPAAQQRAVLEAMNGAAGRPRDYEGEAGAEGRQPASSPLSRPTSRGRKPPYGMNTPFVDGGVLDNKPFGPALSAIFYRMPAGVVDRRLFFVEPDPVPADTLLREQEGAEQALSRLRPASVAMSALTTIPAHESIGGDLDQLKRHNAKIAYLEAVQQRLRDRLSEDESADESGVAAPQDPVYHETRVESLARLLAGAGDQATSADIQPTETWRLDLMKAAIGEPERIHRRGETEETAQAEPAGAQSLDEQQMAAERRLLGFPLEQIDRFDVDHTRRLAFHLLYHYYELLQRQLDGGEADPTPKERRAQAALNALPLRALVQAVGRHIEIIEVVRSGMDRCRDAVFEKHRSLIDSVYGEEKGMTSAERRVVADKLWLDLLAAFARFLDAEAPHWQGLDDELPGLSTLLGASERQSDLPENAIWRRGAALSSALAENCCQSGFVPGLLEPTTILERIKASLDACVAAACQGTRAEMGRHYRRLDHYAQLDRALYPLNFTAGVHELDHIEFVRVSPYDAHLGLSGELDARAKVSGDELAHFAAFMRRDWRSNDILWGRLDGICQIVDSLLDEKALQRLRKHPPRLDDDWLDGFTEAQARSISEAWERLRRAWRMNDEAVQLLEQAPRGKGDGEETLDGTVNPVQMQAALKESLREMSEAGSDFKLALIRAGQEAAVTEDAPSVFQDSHRQDIDFGRISAAQEKESVKVTSSATEEAKDKLAARLAALELTGGGPGGGPGESRSSDQRFLSSGLGQEKIKGSVPDRVIGEYATRAYLILWEMLGVSLGGSAKLMGGRAKFLLRHPIYLLNRLFSLVQEDSLAAAVALAAVTALLLGGGIVLLVLGHIGLGLAALIGFAVMSYVFTRRDSASRAAGCSMRGEKALRRSIWFASAAGLLLTSAMILGVFYLDRGSQSHPLCKAVMFLSDSVTCARK